MHLANTSTENSNTDCELKQFICFLKVICQMETASSAQIILSQFTDQNITILFSHWISSEDSFAYIGNNVHIWDLPEVNRCINEKDLTFKMISEKFDILT